MARKQTVQYIDDLTGKPLTEGEVVAVRFSHKGRNYVLDTNEEGALKFEIEMKTWVDAARRDDRPDSPRSGRKVRRDPAQTRAIRNWAVSNGFEIADRGAIPRDIIEAYEQSTGKK